MADYTMAVYETYDQEAPYVLRYAGDRSGAVDCASRARAFEVDIYEGRGVDHSRCVAVVMYGGNVELC